MNDNTFLKITPTHLESSGVSFEDALRLIASATLQLMRGAMTADPTDEMRQNIYESVNQAMANVLNLFDPTQEPNADFDIDEVIRKENETIREQLELLRQTNPKLYHRQKKAFEKLKADQRAKVIEQDLRRLGKLR